VEPHFLWIRGGGGIGKWSHAFLLIGHLMMADHISVAQRSALMSRIHGRDTRPEILVRSIVHRLGFRFRVGSASVPGKPDLVLRRHRKVILVHGCFWHQHPGCRKSKRPQTRVKFWNAKLDGNIRRDQNVTVQLVEQGWSFLIVWECETTNRRSLEAKLRRFLLGSNSRKRTRVGRQKLRSPRASSGISRDQ
jgi:DNA mismatch endonuclease, patch repair protein